MYALRLTHPDFTSLVTPYDVERGKRTVHRSSPLCAAERGVGEARRGELTMRATIPPGKKVFKLSTFENFIFGIFSKTIIISDLKAHIYSLFCANAV
jgi:hypothetical protein